MADLGIVNRRKEDEKKFAEVMSLMSKYDKAEAKAKWLASPEYAKQQEEKRLEKEREKREKLETDSQLAEK